MKGGLLEEDLRDPVAGYLEGLGFEVHHEVPILHRLADLVGVQGDEVVAVELKLTQWRTAAAQARAYQLAAHRAYVALPEVTVPRVLAAPGPFVGEGIGLLGVEPATATVREVLPACPSPRLLPFLASRVAQRSGAGWGGEYTLVSPAQFLADLWALSE